MQNSVEFPGILDQLLRADIRSNPHQLSKLRLLRIVYSGTPSLLKG